MLRRSGGERGWPVWELLFILVVAGGITYVAGEETSAPAPAPALAEAATNELLIPGTHADQAALTAHLAFMNHKWTKQKYGDKHPKTELTRAIALFQQHYANALAVIGINYANGPIDVVWLRKHIQAKINQLNTHISHISPALSKAISISVPVWFQNGPNVYSRSRSWVSVSPRFINISPCLVALGATGVSIGPTLFNASPRLINVNARGVDLGATLIDIKSRLIDVGPVGYGWDQPTTHVSITPRWINWSPTLRLVDVDHWWPNPVVTPAFPTKGPFPITGPKAVTIYVNKWGKQVPAPPAPPKTAPKPAPRGAPMPAPKPAPVAASSGTGSSMGNPAKASAVVLDFPAESPAGTVAGSFPAGPSPIPAPVEVAPTPVAQPEASTSPMPATTTPTGVEAAVVAPVQAQAAPTPMPAIVPANTTAEHVEAATLTPLPPIVSAARQEVAAAAPGITGPVSVALAPAADAARSVLPSMQAAVIPQTP